MPAPAGRAPRRFGLDPLGGCPAAMVAAGPAGLASTAMAHSKHTDLLVVGGGVIGMAIARRARQAGMAVRLLERGRPGDGASRVAAGMLAPVAEAEFGTAGRGLLELGLSSLRA